MSNLPPLWGLVLAGGRSTRMGQDKGSLNIHGRSQRAFAVEVLSEVCERVFVSCRHDQVAGLEPGLQPVIDEQADLGPLGGIASAFAHDPSVAWLIMACDMPGVTVEALKQLVAGRDEVYGAVAFQLPGTELPEPLLSIWEPAMGPILATAMAAEDRSPRWLLQQAHTHLLACQQPEWLQNINTPDDLTR